MIKFKTEEDLNVTRLGYKILEGNARAGTAVSTPEERKVLDFLFNLAMEYKRKELIKETEAKKKKVCALLVE